MKMTSALLGFRRGRAVLVARTDLQIFLRSRKLHVRRMCLSTRAPSLKLTLLSRTHAEQHSFDQPTSIDVWRRRGRKRAYPRRLDVPAWTRSTRRRVPTSRSLRLLGRGTARPIERHVVKGQSRMCLDRATSPMIVVRPQSLVLRPRETSQSIEFRGPTMVLILLSLATSQAVRQDLCRCGMNHIPPLLPKAVAPLDPHSRQFLNRRVCTAYLASL